MNSNTIELTLNENTVNELNEMAADIVKPLVVKAVEHFESIYQYPDADFKNAEHVIGDYVLNYSDYAEQIIGRFKVVSGLTDEKLAEIYARPVSNYEIGTPERIFAESIMVAECFIPGHIGKTLESMDLTDANKHFELVNSIFA